MENVAEKLRGKKRTKGREKEKKIVSKGIIFPRIIRGKLNFVHEYLREFAKKYFISLHS